MRSLNLPTAKILIFLFLGLVVATGCKKKEEFNEIYELDEFNALPPSSGKLKVKTDEQYVSILYSNLFQEAISVSQLNEITKAMFSVGDKQLAREMVVNTFMKDPKVVLPPANSLVAENLDKFLEETYKRFMIRNISEAERKWFKNYITNTNPKPTVEEVYMAFALSNEYQVY